MTAPRRHVAAIIYAALSAIVIGFQLALAAGAPWGAFAMGGAFPGRLPPALRVAAVVQALVLAGSAGIVLARAGLIRRGGHQARRLVWVVVIVSAVGFVLNVITQSAGERTLWAPVAFLLLATSLIVAIDA